MGGRGPPAPPTTGFHFATWATRPGSSYPHIVVGTTAGLLLPLIMTQPLECNPNAASSRKATCYSTPEPDSLTAPHCR